MAVNNETLSTLRAAVREDVQEPTGTGLITDASIDRFLNEAMIEAIKEAGNLFKEQSITTVASQAGYDLPDDFQNTLTVQYQTSSRKELLKQITKTEYFEADVINEVSIPTHYVLIGEKIYLFQTPSTSDETVSHWYTAYPDKMSSDDDVPFNGIKRYYPYHLGLIAYACSKVFKKAGDMSSANMYMQDWIINIARMKVDMSSREKSGGQIRRWDYINNKPEHPYISLRST